MQSAPKDLLKEYVQSQQFTSTADIMQAMKKCSVTCLSKSWKWRWTMSWDGSGASDQKSRIEQVWQNNLCKHCSTKKPNRIK